MSSSTLREVRFAVDFVRPFHVGAGHGRGPALDAALFTEAVGGGAPQPAIRYAHGVLRQAVYDLLALAPLAHLRRCRASGAVPAPGAAPPPDFCPAGSAPPCPVCRIFGSPARPSPWTFGTLRPEAPAPAPRTVSRSAVDPRTRRAADHALFAEELGAPQRFVLRAARRPPEPAEAEDELAFLVAAAVTIRGVGAGVRRGRGECIVAVLPDVGEPDPTRALLDRFRTVWCDPAREPPLHEAPRPFASPTEAPLRWAAGASGTEAVEVELALRLEEPLVAGARPLTGNLLLPVPFVPGTLLLGALAAWAVEAGVEEDDFLRVFRGGAVRFPDLLPAYESDGLYHPSFPAPLDLSRCREPACPGVWSAVLRAGEGADAGVCPVCGRAGKAERLRGFLRAAADGGAPVRVDVPLRGETKVAIDPAKGRVGEGSLYHRRALATGTLLSGTMRAEATAWAQLSAWALPGTQGSRVLHLGKRHGRGYGRATLAWEAHVVDERTEVDALEARVGARIDQGLPIALLLRGRALLRDAFGRTLRALDAAALGLSGTSHGAVDSVMVSGYWRHIGLPRRQEAALVAGSVAHVYPAGDPAAFRERLRALERDGIGERRGEGFGAVVVEPLVYAHLRGETTSAPARAVPDALRRMPSTAEPTEPGAEQGDWMERLRPHADLLRPRARTLAEAEAPPAEARDEWRTVARQLHAVAGADAETVRRALLDGTGRAQCELDGFPERTPKRFLQDREPEGWAVLSRLIDEAAAGTDPRLRGRRTRALADALAAVSGPRKGVE